MARRPHGRDVRAGEVAPQLVTTFEPRGLAQTPITQQALPATAEALARRAWGKEKRERAATRVMAG